MVGRRAARGRAAPAGFTLIEGIAFGDIAMTEEEGSFTRIGSPFEQVSVQVPAPRFDFDRHRTGANVAFCDGHVEFGTRQRFDTGLDQVRRRWNTDNEPHPEYWK